MQLPGMGGCFQCCLTTGRLVACDLIAQHKRNLATPLPVIPLRRVARDHFPREMVGFWRAINHVGMGREPGYECGRVLRLLWTCGQHVHESTRCRHKPDRRHAGFAARCLLFYRDLAQCVGD